MKRGRITKDDETYINMSFQKLDEMIKCLFEIRNDVESLYHRMLRIKYGKDRNDIL